MSRSICGIEVERNEEVGTIGVAVLTTRAKVNLTREVIVIKATSCINIGAAGSKFVINISGTIHNEPRLFSVLTQSSAIVSGTAVVATMTRVEDNHIIAPSGECFLRDGERKYCEQNK